MCAGFWACRRSEKITWQSEAGSPSLLTPCLDGVVFRLAASGTRLLSLRATARQFPRTPIQFREKDSAAAYRLTDEHAVPGPPNTAAAFCPTTHGLRNIRNEGIRRAHGATRRVPSNPALAEGDECPRPLLIPQQPASLPALP